MTRKPIFFKDKDGNNITNHRLCSMPGGQWQLQRYSGASSREQDGWEAMGRTTDLETATRQFHTREGAR